MKLLMVPITLLCASLTLSACGGESTSTATATGSSTPVSREAAGAMDIATGAYKVYSLYDACMKNIDAGLPCTATDSSNIRAIYAQLKAFEEQVETNHRQTLDRFNILENAVRERTLDVYIDALKALDLNGDNAMRAYFALSECLVSAVNIDATCQAFIGGSALEDPQPVKEALAETESYFAEQVSFMGRNIDVTIAEFTGSSSRRGENGLAHAAWMLGKRKQDQDLGVTKQEVMNSVTASVVTRELADGVNFYLDSYESIFDRYGFLLVTAAGIEGGKNGDARARATQATVNAKIVSDANRFTLSGAAKHYRMPVMQDREITVVLEGKPTVVGGKSGLGRGLSNSDITNVAAALNNYSTVNKVSAAAPDAFPADRMYTVSQNVRPFNHVAYSCAFLTGCGYKVDIKSHALAGTDSSTTCPVRMRPMNSKPPWDNAFEYWLNAEPSMGRNFFWNTYEQQVKGSVDYEWNTGNLARSRGADFKYGWGALVSCLNGQQLDSAKDLNPGMFPMIKG